MVLFILIIHPRSLTLQRCRRPSGRPWPGVLGRYINDTWPATAGPLYRPLRPRFLGPGRVLGQTPAKQIKRFLDKSALNALHSYKHCRNAWAAVLQYSSSCHCNYVYICAEKSTKIPITNKINTTQNPACQRIFTIFKFDYGQRHCRVVPDW